MHSDYISQDAVREGTGNCLNVVWSGPHAPANRSPASCGAVGQEVNKGMKDKQVVNVHIWH